MEDDAPLSSEFLRKLEYLRVVAKRLQAGRYSALQRSRKMGRGIDFADHRPYTPGDDFKDIDWNLFGRLDRFLIRLAEEETEVHLHLLVDCSASMDSPKGLFVRKTATALAYVALSHLDRVHLWPFADGLRKPLHVPRNKAEAVAIHRALAAEEPGRETDLVGSLKSFVGLTRDKGIALVFSDFLAPGGWQAGFDVLRSARFDAGIVQVFDPEDAEPPATGEVVLIDRETQRPLRVRITDDLAERYRRAFVAHGEGLRHYARSHRLFYAQARSDQPFEELVLGTLRAERLLA